LGKHTAYGVRHTVGARRSEDPPSLLCGGTSRDQMAEVGDPIRKLPAPCSTLLKLLPLMSPCRWPSAIYPEAPLRSGVRVLSCGSWTTSEFDQIAASCRHWSTAGNENTARPARGASLWWEAKGQFSKLKPQQLNGQSPTGKFSQTFAGEIALRDTSDFAKKNHRGCPRWFLRSLKIADRAADYCPTGSA
jgi:hypothetical protein